MVSGFTWRQLSEGFPSNWDSIDTYVNKLTGYHDCYRCISLLDKYYGHQHYQIHFAHAELQCQNEDIQSGNHFNLVDSFTREEIEVEFILDYLFTESQVQKTMDALNIMENSALEFIWKIGDQSMHYTTDSYQQKLKIFGSLWTRESSFNNFIRAFVDWNFKEALSVTNNVLFCWTLPGEWGRPEDECIRRKIGTMIMILNKDTCQDIEGWEGHPCIPKRVFRPKEYLVTPLIQLSKLRVTSRPLPATSSRSVLTCNQPWSEDRVVTNPEVK